VSFRSLRREKHMINTEAKNHHNHLDSSIEEQQVIITLMMTNMRINSRLEEDNGNKIMEVLLLLLGASEVVEDLYLNHLASKMLRIFSGNSLELVCKTISKNNQKTIRTLLLILLLISFMR